MRKYFYPLAIILMWTLTATTCYDYDHSEEAITSLKTVSLVHYNNEKESPVIADPPRVKKEAYILGILLECEEIERADKYKLEKPVKEIKIFTQTNFTDKYLKGSEITDCFKNYPKNLHDISPSDIHKPDTVNFMNYSKLTIYKALRTIPEPGEYQFSAVIVLSDDSTLEAICDPVNLY